MLQHPTTPHAADLELCCTYTALDNLPLDSSSQRTPAPVPPSSPVCLSIVPPAASQLDRAADHPIVTKVHGPGNP
jgi:hypothetical protein